MCHSLLARTGLGREIAGQSRQGASCRRGSFSVSTVTPLKVLSGCSKVGSLGLLRLYCL